MYYLILTVEGCHDTLSGAELWPGFQSSVWPANERPSEIAGLLVRPGKAPIPCRLGLSCFDFFPDHDADGQRYDDMFLRVLDVTAAEIPTGTQLFSNDEGSALALASDLTPVDISQKCP